MASHLRAPPGGSQLRLAELLGSLSYALDMTEGQPAGHCVRCCWIGMHIGRHIGLADDDLHDLYYTLLLKDLGCSSNAARICELYISPDLDLKRDFKTIDGSLPQVLRFVLTHTGLRAGLAERFRALLNLMQNGGEITRELIETRCQRGAEIARQMRFSDGVAGGILALDEHWDGKGKPLGLQGPAISIHARIALLAQVIDVFQTSADRAAALHEVRRRTGSWFDPALVVAFERVAAREDFWAMLACEHLQDTVFAQEPAQRSELVDEDYLDDIAAAFAEVVDSKSPYTSGHSKRVALFTDLISEDMGCDPAWRRWLKRVALLHDIGKLGVSNTILDKPAKLDDAEWVEMKRHAELSEVILARIGPFREMARIAGAHHERLDGKGYPRGIASEAICLGTRIITTADIFDALTAERPYRAAMPISKAFAIMSESLGTAIDPICFAALQAAMARLEARNAASILQAIDQARLPVTKRVSSHQ